ncbi:RNA polymerase-associated protein LEO1-like [Etheostoma spectabile]|uniref:RNA polymerase-associated protein LEO1-like n=1 Tax=Etheostoma spectabile TaxID=54343 RepID=UPI0013AEDBD1|nr:RNA polymerase-associated protein LEO1-like [Etheostoma spectabile]
MAFRLPGGTPEEHLPDSPRGRIHGLHMLARQGRADNFPRPAEPGLPEEEGEYDIGHRFPPLREDEHQFEEWEDEDPEDEDDWPDWSVDPGYGSMTEEGENAEEEEQVDVENCSDSYGDGYSFGDVDRDGDVDSDGGSGSGRGSYGYSLGPSTFRRYWMVPLDNMRGTEDSDSD